jgi:hypothetical protein
VQQTVSVLLALIYAIVGTILQFSVHACHRVFRRLDNPPSV